MKINYVKITAYICSFILYFTAIYDLISISLSKSIDSSVSIWFASFGSSFVPLFGMSFLLGHFFGNPPVKNSPKPAKMTRFKFGCTVSVIVASLYDTTTLKFFDASHAISSIPILVELAKWPISLLIVGIICGKYLGTMSPTRPAGN